jgi:rod shape-determining protein MreC
MLRSARGQPSTRPLAILVVLALVLTVWQHRARSGQGSGESRRSLPERVAVALVWPLEKGLAISGAAVHRTASSLGRARELAARCAKLENENEELRAQQLKLIDALIENQRLKKTLGFAVGQPPEAMAARVVSFSFSLGRKRLWIAAPPGRELEVNNIVRTEAGLVGRVATVTASGSRGEVFLLVDAEHAVSGRVALRSRDQGMVNVSPQPANRPDLLVMSKLIGRSDVREGDVVLTSGLGEVYPPGIPIGVVTRVERSAAGTVDLRAYIRPAVDFEHLEWVLVERHGKQH